MTRDVGPNTTILAGLNIFSFSMADRLHKAHRPAQSGAKADKKNKGKEKQQGFNEKVGQFYSDSIHTDIVLGLCAKIRSTSGPSRQTEY